MKKNVLMCIVAMIFFSGCGITEAMTLISVSNTLMKYTKSPSSTNYSSSRNSEFYSQEQGLRFDDGYYSLRSHLSEYGSLELMEVGDLN